MQHLWDLGKQMHPLAGSSMLPFEPNKDENINTVCTSFLPSGNPDISSKKNPAEYHRRFLGILYITTYNTNRAVDRPRKLPVAMHFRGKIVIMVRKLSFKDGLVLNFSFSNLSKLPRTEDYSEHDLRADILTLSSKFTPVRFTQCAPVT